MARQMADAAKEAAEQKAGGGAAMELGSLSYWDISITGGGGGGGVTGDELI